MQRPGLAECPYPVSNKNSIICAIYTAAKIMTIMSIQLTVHPEKGFFCQVTVLIGQNAFETSSAPLVHRNSVHRICK
jgi:hypothetical protein